MTSACMRKSKSGVGHSTKFILFTNLGDFTPCRSEAHRGSSFARLVVDMLRALENFSSVGLFGGAKNERNF